MSQQWFRFGIDQPPAEGQRIFYRRFNTEANPDAPVEVAEATYRGGRLLHDPLRVKLGLSADPYEGQPPPEDALWTPRA